MSEHTPSPWEAYDANEGMDKAYGPLWCVSDDRYHNPPDDGYEYCFQAQINCGCEADARLIAAAPDLLAALIEMRNLFDMMCGLGLNPAEGREGSLKANADAAIAKALGISK